MKASTANQVWEISVGRVIRTQCFNCQAPGSISKSCGMMAKKEKKTERKSREKTKFNFKGHALLYFQHLPWVIQSSTLNSSNGMKLFQLLQKEPTAFICARNIL